MATARRNLGDHIANELSERLRGGEWKPGDRLPTEHQLADEYGVSRATVRSALQRLDTVGLTVTRHGLGTFAAVDTQEIQADLRRLESLSATVRSYGLDPGMTYRARTVRVAAADELKKLDLRVGAEVVATERALTASGTVVAFSYDAIDRRLLPSNFRPTTIEGSLFELLEHHGNRVTTAVTELHAVSGGDIGWGRRPRRAAHLLLSQVHYLDNSRPVMYSRTYFIEGRFTFSLVRTR
ncbi:MAG: GntR family transcriptional regulator [Acidimicrobiia bacterium]